MTLAARRFAALVIAVALVGAAIGIRAVLDDDGSGGTGSSSDAPLRLLCARELAVACDDLASRTDVRVTIASEGDTVATLSGVADADLAGLGYDGWLTFERDAQIVRDARERAALRPAVGVATDPIGRSPLVLAVWDDRASVLAQSCGEVDWRCLGDVAGTRWDSIGGDVRWGAVKPGHADPADHGDGLAVIGQAATQFLGRPDPSRDDYADDAFLEWFGRLERAVPGGLTAAASPFERMLTAGPAAYDAVGTHEAEAGPLLARAAGDRRDQVRLLYPAPVATLDVVYAPLAGARRADALRETVTGDDGRGALARAGWRVAGEDRARGIPSAPNLPDTSNLPDAGSLVALLETWREITG
ncbi:MAG: substrate-binding domain-containing protein [Acidimicrobiia bacterium]